MTDRRSPLPPDWPFAVPRGRLFYGWVIWLMSTLGVLMSIPGQTMGMAVFTEHFIAAFDLSRTQLSMAYLIGTLGSAVLLTRAGRLYDRYGGRVLVVAAALGLATVLVYFSLLETLLLVLNPGTLLAFALVTLGYFGVRFAGQGVLTSASRNVLLHWFERRQGLVTGLRGVFVSLGFSAAPLLLASLIAATDWRSALLLLAAACGPLFAVAALILLRDDPESCGLRADNAGTGGDAGNVARPYRTLAQARRSPVFWLYAASLSMHSLFITAITFHVVDVFAEAGRSNTAAFAMFLPVAVLSTITNLASGALADRFALKPFLVLMLGAFLAGATGLLLLASDAGYLLLVTGLGVGGGLWAMVSNLAFVRFFGLLYLGEISGLNASAMVFASALGPALFSLSADRFDSYAPAVALSMALMGALLVAALALPQRELAH